MAEEFLTESPTEILPNPTEPPTREHREPVRVILVGSRLGILAVVHWLIRLGFTQMADWSNWQSVPNSRKWMR
ncbi:MAG TPA: hypothetical protein IGS17_04670, partial [Oscillatoriales cyanobacterium M59_W2019_021]